jgi:hypothetical protein
VRQSYILDFYSDIIVMDINTEGRVCTTTQSSDRSSSRKDSVLRYTKLSGGGTVSVLSCAFCFFILSITIGGAIPITQLVIGILYNDACPVNYLIPIYLIVAGAIGLVIIAITIVAVSTFLINVLIIKLILFDNINFYKKLLF